MKDQTRFRNAHVQKKKNHVHITSMLALAGDAPYLVPGQSLEKYSNKLIFRGRSPDLWAASWTFVMKLKQPQKNDCISPFLQMSDSAGQHRRLSCSWLSIPICVDSKAIPLSDKMLHELEGKGGPVLGKRKMTFCATVLGIN